MTVASTYHGLLQDCPLEFTWVIKARSLPTATATGTIIEAKLDPGKGPVATVLVESGTLYVGDAVMAGTASGKIRAMIDDRGRQVQRAGPSMPVELLGLSSTPLAGDRLQVAESERIARQMVQERELQNLEATNKEDTDMVAKLMENLRSPFYRVGPASTWEGRAQHLMALIRQDVATPLAPDEFEGPVE